jgi:hypothetical protein
MQNQEERTTRSIQNEDRGQNSTTVDFDQPIRVQQRRQLADDLAILVVRFHQRLDNRPRESYPEPREAVDSES